MTRPLSNDLRERVVAAVCGGEGGKQPPVDPIIQGLLVRLPASGSVWSEDERKLWLNLLEGSFKLIYKDKEAAN